MWVHLNGPTSPRRRVVGTKQSEAHNENKRSTQTQHTHASRGHKMEQT